MKTNNRSKTMLAMVATVAVAFATWLPTTVVAQDEAPMKPMKPAEMMMMKPINTTEQAAAVQPDDTFVMVCGKCKTVYTTHLKQGVKGAELLASKNGPPTELIGTHACSGCGGTWTITGVGKGAKTSYKHTCSMCGDDSGFCCATSPSSGPTKGMEEEKK